MKKLTTSIRVFVFFAVIFGLFYPLAITVISNYLFPHQAHGSLIKKNDQVIGSSLIAQEFTSPKYFHSRPSFVNYDAQNSGGSNFGPANKKWVRQIQEQTKKYRHENALAPETIIPPDAISTSGSGLDPHISLGNALLQAPRVAAARKIPEEKIKKLIHSNFVHDLIGIWGNTGVNVLQLNLALDKLSIPLTKRISGLVQVNQKSLAFPLGDEANNARNHKAKGI